MKNQQKCLYTEIRPQFNKTHVATHLPAICWFGSLSWIWSMAWEREESGFNPLIPCVRTVIPCEITFTRATENAEGNKREAEISKHVDLNHWSRQKMNFFLLGNKLLMALKTLLVHLQGFKYSIIWLYVLHRADIGLCMCEQYVCLYINVF